MNMEFKRKLPAPRTVKDMYPVSEELAQNKRDNDRPDAGCHHRRGRPRLMLLIGPCSADREDAVLEYAARLRWTGGPLLSALSAERLNSTDRKPLLFAHFPSGARPQRRV